MADKPRSGLNTREIALIKAMLQIGKKAAFHSGRIQAYFSRPDRTINPARIYEIRDGTLGADIPPASETELYDFLTRYVQLPMPDDETRSGFPRLPPPAYIGVRQKRVRLLPRRDIIHDDDEEYTLRDKLLREQHRLAGQLSNDWRRYQVDQRLKYHLDEYYELTRCDHVDINIFSIDTEYNSLRRSLSPDTGGLGDSGEAMWDRFSQNHVVLRTLYPEMQYYLAAFASLGEDTTLPEVSARQILHELSTDEVKEFVDPEVTGLIKRRMDDDTDGAQEKARKRTYDVAAMMTRTLALVRAIAETTPRIAGTVNAAYTLYDRMIVPLREILRKLGWW